MPELYGIPEMGEYAKVLPISILSALLFASMGTRLLLLRNPRQPSKGSFYCASREFMQLPQARPAILSPGQQLRIAREQLGLTMREVESASVRVAAKHGNEEYA